MIRNTSVFDYFPAPPTNTHRSRTALENPVSHKNHDFLQSLLRLFNCMQPVFLCPRSRLAWPPASRALPSPHYGGSPVATRFRLHPDIKSAFGENWFALRGTGTRCIRSSRSCLLSCPHAPAWSVFSIAIFLPARWLFAVSQCRTRAMLFLYWNPFSRPGSIDVWSLLGATFERRQWALASLSDRLRMGRG